MYFPNAQVAISLYPLLLLGLIVGTLGGFFGVGGGFLITGGLLVFGVPPVFALGTGLALVLGTSIIGTLRHRRAGNVDVKLGLLLAGGSLPAVFLAERLVVTLEGAGLAGPVVRYVYVFMLTALAGFIIYDTWRNRPSRQAGSSQADQVSTQGLIRRVQAWRIPPHSIKLPGVRPISTRVALPISVIPQLSAFVPLAAGVGIGLLAGLLGAGGGFMMVPLLIYVLGVRTRVAVGTGLFQVVLTGATGTFLYARSSHVDLVMAMVMLVAASAGSRLGVAATRAVAPNRIRFLFSLTLLGGALAVALKQIAESNAGLGYLSTVAGTVMLTATGSICLVMVVLLAMSLRKEPGAPR